MSKGQVINTNSFFEVDDAGRRRGRSERGIVLRIPTRGPGDAETGTTLTDRLVLGRQRKMSSDRHSIVSTQPKPFFFFS